MGMAWRKAECRVGMNWPEMSHSREPGCLDGSHQAMFSSLQPQTTDIEKILIA